MAAYQAQAVQHGLQEDHVQPVRPVQVTRARGGNHMCSNPDTYEFRLSLDLPQQSAVPTDTFSALREVHEYSAENGPRFHTAAEMFILWEYDRSRHENITYDGIWFCRC